MPNQSEAVEDGYEHRHCAVSAGSCDERVHPSLRDRSQVLSSALPVSRAKVFLYLACDRRVAHEFYSARRCAATVEQLAV